MYESMPCSFCTESCGGREYNTTLQFCSENSIYDLCGGRKYDPLKQKCERDVVLTKCGNSYYNSSMEFCSDNVVYIKCNKTYDPSYQICANNVIMDRCGSPDGDYYNPSTQFCSSYGVYDLCNNQSYFPENQRCDMGNIIAKCGNDWYNPTAYTQYCKDGTILTQYGSITYSGQTYRTVEIGTQTWMAENLNYSVNGSKCSYNNTANCNTYGRLYDWATAMTLPDSCNSVSCENQINLKHQGICPSNWHLPSDTDWETLKSYIERDKGCTYCAANYLKAASGWYSNGERQKYGDGPWFVNSGDNGTDDYGFSALPSDRGTDGYQWEGGTYGYWWSYGKNSSGRSFIVSMNYYDSGLHGPSDGYNREGDKYSVRCLQD